MEDQWFSAFLGGVCIGLAATILWLFSGRVAGISGVFFGLIKPQRQEFLWRVLLVVGLVVGGSLASLWLDNPFANTTGAPLLVIAVAGLLVGFGTRLGNGCTSGHGVCGISRLSLRSLVATIMFIAAGAVTVFITSSI